MILTVFVKGYEKREMETMKFLLMLPTCKYHINFITAETDDLNAYPQFVKDNWNKEDLIMLEHDIVPTQEQIDALLNCNYDLCNYSYYIPISANNGYGLLDTGLGLAKFSLNFQRNNNVNEVFNTNTFINIDAKVNEYLNAHNYKWHNHGIVKHNHKVEDLVEDYKLKSF